MKGPREPRRGRSRVIQFRCLSPSTRSAGVSRPPPPTGSHAGQAAPHRASFPGPLEHIMRGACRCSAQLRAHWLSPPQSLSRATPPLLSAQGLVIISRTTSRSGTWRASFSSAKWPPPDALQVSWPSFSRVPKWHFRHGEVTSLAGGRRFQTNHPSRTTQVPMPALQRGETPV